MNETVAIAITQISANATLLGDLGTGVESLFHERQESRILGGEWPSYRIGMGSNILDS